MFGVEIKLKMELFVRFFVALILLVAAGLKAHQLATTPSLGDGLLHARWFNIFVVEFELFFGIWLIFGLLPKLSWLASVGLFSMLSVISFYKAAILKETSCGCFGATEINPWFTTVLDLMIVLILVVFRPKEIIFKLQNFFMELGNFKRFRLVIIFVLTWFLVTVPITFILVSAKFETFTSNSVLNGHEKSIVIEPSQWIGKDFPLSQFLEDTVVDKVVKGEQNIVLFNFDCEECKRVVENIHNKSSYIFIAIPSEKNNKVLFDLPEYSMLPDKYQWWADTPIIIVLENGIVKKISKGVE
ncbi:MAG: hypothetical protein LBP59_16640 [Planctomycetaceae bacterium]|jgi:hypothetical protein|nr:hypothetical protein [Planctomycetaceae bacterium]